MTKKITPTVCLQGMRLLGACKDLENGLAFEVSDERKVGGREFAHQCG